MFNLLTILLKITGIFIFSFGLINPVLAADKDSMGPTLTCYGAAGSISGSCFLLDTGSDRILLDCGSFFEEALLERNNSLPFQVQSLSAVIVSHAHLDHCGRIPLLFKNGYRGDVLCAKPTKDIAAVMLPLQNQIYRMNGRFAPSTRRDVEVALSHFRELAYGEQFPLPGGAIIDLQPAGHILGSAMVRVRFGHGNKQRTLVFSGDFGNSETTILKARATFKRADYVILESTYGGRNHGDYEKERERFYALLKETAARRSVTVIPSYVLDRTQKIVALIQRGISLGKVPASLSLYIDSPSATKLTRLYAEHPNHFAPEYSSSLQSLSTPFTDRRIHFHREFDVVKTPAVVIAPSSNASVGKVVSYIERYIEDPDASICFVSSYQPPNSLSEALVRGDKEVTIEGDNYVVRARINEFGTFSSHGDQNQILSWLKKFHTLGHVFLVHGLTDVMPRFKNTITKKLGVRVTIPKLDTTYNLGRGKDVQKKKHGVLGNDLSFPSSFRGGS